MELKRSQKISSMLAERIAAGDFPSAVYIVAEKGSAIFADAMGYAVREPERREATLETVYDLASLTKPLVTGLLSAKMIERGRLKLDSAASFYLPEFDRDDKRAITVRQLLTHTSGLPAWRPLYLIARTKEKVLDAVANEPLHAMPGTHVVYSDLGFITLGLLLEKLYGAQLSEIARREIFDPLNLARTFFNPSAAMRTGVAACETGNAYERGMCGAEIEKYGAVNFREEIIWGEVHDGNAHFLGGAAGHAGLFSTAQETLRIATQFHANLTELLQPATCALFRENMTEGMEEARSLAWQLAATKDSSAGPELPLDSFGHLGFTGTSCWNDPQQERTFILLTNRTHARTLPFVNINGVRRMFHTLAVEAMEERREEISAL